MDKNGKEIACLQAEQCMKQLQNHGFSTSYFETKEEAFHYLQEVIEKNAVIANGGSMTLKEMGVIDWLTDNPDYHYLDRNHTDDPHRIFHESFNADVYLMSSNAVTLDGMLYNVDGTGNRVAALIYGPKKVYVVVGTNKIVRNIEDAITRNEMISGPYNNKRLKKGNPCEDFGQCMHCLKDTSICNQFVVTRRSGIKDRIHVIIINEELGY